ncbi:MULTISPECIES: hypothetical protein [Rhodococcus]|uniref:hypothetical protein n=1 Tax=Rhodococcus TaxID=1827 RepID=UPI002868B5A7|nr:hypothetical protein [Rhodococcus pyridinivorans]
MSRRVSVSRSIDPPSLHSAAIVSATSAIPVGVDRYVLLGEQRLQRTTVRHPRIVRKIEEIVADPHPSLDVDGHFLVEGTVGTAENIVGALR